MSDDETMSCNALPSSEAAEVPTLPNKLLRDNFSSLSSDLINTALQYSLALSYIGCIRLLLIMFIVGLSSGTNCSALNKMPNEVLVFVFSSWFCKKRNFSQ